VAAWNLRTISEFASKQRGLHQEPDRLNTMINMYVINNVKGNGGGFVCNALLKSLLVRLRKTTSSIFLRNVGIFYHYTWRHIQENSDKIPFHDNISPWPRFELRSLECWTGLLTTTH
jgi:hypothetical protein